MGLANIISENLAFMRNCSNITVKQFLARCTIGRIEIISLTISFLISTIKGLEELQIWQASDKLFSPSSLLAKDNRK